MFCTTCAQPNPIAGATCCRCGQPLTARALGDRRTRTAGSVVSWVGLYGLPGVLALVLAVGLVRWLWLEPIQAIGRAQALAAAGRVPEALDAYARAGDRGDARTRAAELAERFAPLQHQVGFASATLAEADAEAAIDLLLPVVRALPRYDAARALLAEARAAWRADLTAMVDQAARAEDWLLAQSTLATLLALDPTDAAVRARLEQVGRDHAPIVLAQDRALQLAAPNGEAVTLPVARQAAWPTWSPDRARIAFTAVEARGGTIALYVVDRDGTNARRLAIDLRPYAAPVWSPDGTRIAFASTGGGEEEIGRSEPYPPDVVVVDVATGETARVTGGRILDPLSASWSPDGTRLAVVSRTPDASFGFESPPIGDPNYLDAGDVYVVSLATGETRDVTRGRIDHPWRVAWSPTDERLLVYSRAPGMSYDRDLGRIALLDLRSGAMTDLPTGGDKVTAPVWSPTGDRIAYATDDSAVVIHRLDGTRTKIAIPEIASRLLSWNAAGTALLAPGEAVGTPAFVVTLGAAGDEPSVDTLPLNYDRDRRQSGSPQWGSGYPVPAPEPPGLGGTALDHE